MEDPIYIFVDNSNIFIEGQKAAALAKNSSELGKRYRLDFGRLFDYIANNRGEVFIERPGHRIYPKLYGSEPPKLDTLWARLEEMGVDCKVFQRKWSKEKRVDAALIRDVEQLLYRYRYDPKTIIALVAGDLDYFDLVSDIQEAGWNAEIYCWEHSTAKEIRSLECYYNLTPYITDVGFFERDKVEHSFGDWDEDIDWSKKIPYD